MNVSIDIQERAARAALARFFPPADVWADLAFAGPIEVWAQRRHAGRSPILRNHDALRALREGQLSARFITPADGEYPRRQLEVLGKDAPLGLWVRGEANLAQLAIRSLAVTGSRASTEKGRAVTSELVGTLASGGYAITTSLASGHDLLAHEAAQKAGAHSVLVIPRGLDVAFPTDALSSYIKALHRGSCAVSLAAPGVECNGHLLHRHLRLRAALATGVVITEANLGGRELEIAAHAMELRRPLLVADGVGSKELQPLKDARLVAAHSLRDIRVAIEAKVP
ncbi:DNA-protecting protein DprA (plasmid) [Streptomyces sp. NBC_01527]|uniref:DNA-processing protein DprA n=1 Tax=Streptomyces sp. NBC_01527 TaxID=2903894 RepID=UPI002F913241